MKKIYHILTVAVLLSMAIPAKAQFGDYGVKLGLGVATMRDDITSLSPVLGLNVGGYIDYTFLRTESAFSEVFFLQTGLNLTHRGGHYQEHWEMANHLHLRTGFYDSWYAQLPILACMHFELPIRQEGHVVGAFLGPAVSFGLFGRYGDRNFNPGVPTADANYDVNFNGSKADRQVFNHLNRLDVSLQAGLTYEFRNLNVGLCLDYGFLATSSGTDVLRIIERNQSGVGDVSTEIPNGYNMAIMLMLTYKLGSFIKE